MAASGLHEAVKAPASVWSVLILCVLSSSPGAWGLSRSTQIEERLRAVENENTKLKQEIEDRGREDDRRFNDLNEGQKEMNKKLDKLSDEMHRVAEKVGAK